MSVAIQTIPRTLDQLEAIVERGKTTFIQVGLALREIHDRKLYKKNYSSFEEYCRTRWGWTRSNGYRYIKAAEYVSENVDYGLQISSRNQALAAARGLEVHYSSDTGEWYTPPEIIQRVEKTLSRIDLDPCSDVTETIPAARRFTKADDGLRFEWHGRVYMNPPYGREIGLWVEKLVSEYQAGRTTQAIALVPARTDTDWFHLFRDSVICFVDGRLKFSGSENSAPFPSAVVYLGENVARFASNFEDIGDIWVRWTGRYNP